MIFDDNSLSIGRTPLVRLNRVVAGARATVLAKIEGRNPAYSVKCRIGASMVWDAERRGVLRPGIALVEPTSGNTGIALAFVAAARGYRLTLTMPDTMSVERRKVLAALGARLVLTAGALGMKAAIAKAEEIRDQAPERIVLLDQFNNPANPDIHFSTTGPEIWEDTGGAVDVVVSGIGTGGTITGVARYLKRVRGRPIVAVGVEPEASPVITQTLKGTAPTPAPHKIQGIGAGFIPGTLDLSVVDRVETVSNDEAIEMARRLGREEGILSGISCGAAVAVALRLARLLRRGPRRARVQGRGDRDGAAPGARGGHPVGDLLRRRRRGRAPARAARRVRGQDDRRRAPGLGRALPQHGPLRGDRLMSRVKELKRQLEALSQVIEALDAELAAGRLEAEAHGQQRAEREREAGRLFVSLRRAQREARAREAERAEPPVTPVPARGWLGHPLVLAAGMVLLVWG